MNRPTLLLLMSLAMPCIVAADEAPTYYGKISHIFMDRCVSCHRQGAIGPFALDTYERVRSKRSTIRQVIEEGVMPPWHAAEGSGPWINDMSLSREQRQAIFSWIDAGCPEGDPAAAPAPRSWPQPGEWSISPDAVLQIPEAYEIPAEGVLDYKVTYIKTEFAEDRWIAAYQIKPTAPQIVHHVLVFIEDPPRPDEDRRAFRRRQQGGLEGYFISLVPGRGAVTYPRGTAKKLPAGAWLKVQIHYTPNGKPATDQMQIGLVFADGPPATELRTAAVAETRFEVPPGESNHQVVAMTILPAGTVLHGFSPHMHLRGKAFRYELAYPDGTSQILLDVPRYDFNWQTFYRLKSPLQVNRPAALRCTAWFDNSADNPSNPDPAAVVRFGRQTWDEMMIGYFEWSRGPAAESLSE